jgi:ABC-type tungstate transport system permease subunit
VSAACSANGPVGRYVAEDHSRNALLLDDRPAEDKIIADGYGVVRFDAMYDDFVIVGPSSDPAGIRGFNDAGKAFAQIAATGALFASRGDDSGTNRLELRIWKSAGAEPDKQAAWYRDVTQRMEETLNLAAAMNAYTITDRATWANFKKRQILEILTEGDSALFDTFGNHPYKSRLLHARGSGTNGSRITTAARRLRHIKSTVSKFSFRRISRQRTNDVSERIAKIRP